VDEIAGVASKAIWIIRPCAFDLHEVHARFAKHLGTIFGRREFENWRQKLAIHGSDKVSANRVKLDCTLAAQADDLNFCQKQVLFLPNVAVDQLREPRNVIVLGHILRAPILL
jgi:hypothetical protein